MTYYYTSFQSRSHAFLVEQRMKNEGVSCELAYMPRDIMKDLCNMGVKFDESQFPAAVDIIRRTGLPGCRLYKEIISPSSSKYIEVGI